MWSVAFHRDRLVVGTESGWLWSLQFGVSQQDCGPYVSDCTLVDVDRDERASDDDGSSHNDDDDGSSHNDDGENPSDGEGGDGCDGENYDDGGD